MAGEIDSATFVVVGGGIAGVSCVEGLSFLCPERRIILITASPFVKTVTNIIPLTKMLTQFDVEEKDAEALSAAHPSLSVIHDSVVKLDSADHTIITRDGRYIQYEKLCICTGAYPKVIAEGNPYVIGIRDTESVRDFEKRIATARKILVVGNGGIATEVVHELEGIEIVWAIKDKHISATFIDPGAAEFFLSQLQKDKPKKPVSTVKRLKYTASPGKDGEGHGAALGPDWHANINLSRTQSNKSKVSIEYECEVKKVLDSKDMHSIGEDWPVYAELTNGKIVGCDFIVSATGVIPNSSMFVDGNDLELSADGGIKVNWLMETSVQDVFAAGDVCTASWEHARHWFQMRLWTQARQMGMYAAKTMVGSYKNEEVYQDFCFELFSHVTNFFGFKVVLLGLFNGQKLNGEYEILLRVSRGMEYVKLVMRDGKLEGAVLIGETDLEEMCENLILDQLDLSIYGEDLLNPEIDVDDYFD
ncbi:pyridine nucleotide-disulfide oxidoreductase domain-containing protein 1 [Anabrus simplex]|uniref:pyridine nucleotide-disulfide oxidoreductase domain-containing protein 1 n=1 Tax=Anabrus simplex TaxID=316456 RepID=UPI0035A395BA